jgi:hypothetical protein
MGKKLIVTLVAVFILCVASTAFAGPFADVPVGHWAYSAINQLAKDGIVAGYGDADFGGDKTMTRYEMAIVVGKALEYSGKADKANKALIDKLSAEFAKELDTLGVRVATVEKKIDKLEKIKITGDFYIRNLGEKDSVDNSDASGSYWRSRIRLNVESKIDDSMTAFVRFTSRNLFGSSTASRDGWQTDTSPSYQQLDQYNIKVAANGFTYKVGRQDALLGQGMLISTGGDAQWPNQFDGVVASGKLGAIDTTVIVGTTTRSNSLNGYGDTRAKWYGMDMKAKAAENLSVGVAFAHHKFENDSSILGPAGATNMWAVNTSYNAAPNLTFNAEYARSSYETDNRAYFVSATYAMGKNSLTATYVDTQRYSVDAYNSVYGALIPLNFGAGIVIDGDTYAPLARNYKAWQYYYYHPLTPNTFLDVYVIDAKVPGYKGHDLEWFAGWNVNF